MHETDDEPDYGKDNISSDWSKDIIDGLIVARTFLESDNQVGSRWFSLIQKTNVSIAFSIYRLRE
jgi:hypothetical protein